jgi:uncharacterized membrane protein
MTAIIKPDFLLFRASIYNLVDARTWFGSNSAWRHGRGYYGGGHHGRL